MSKRIIPFDNLKKIILKDGYGTYRLFAINGDLLGGSHLTADEKLEKIEVGQLVNHLNDLVELNGEGVYLIKLKANNSTKNISEVTYYFQNGDNQVSQPVTQPSGLSGLTSEKLEDIIQKRVDQRLSEEREKNARDRIITELQNEIKALKTQRVVRRKKDSEWMRQLGDLGKMAAATLISEKWPNAVPLVEKVIDGMALPADEDDDLDEEEQTGFSRPE